MLSKKYLTIKKALTHLSKNDLFHRKMSVLTQMYTDIDKGFRFSYLSEENGEANFIKTLSNHYKDDFVFFDVGAHIGTYTDIVIEKFDKYEGHLFDVTKDTFEKCLERHGNNKALNINNAALTDKVGEVEYRSYPDDPTRNGISGVSTEGGFKYELLTAPCWTGDHYCKKHKINHINLLKIDAEGYDLHVLKGFKNMLGEGKIDVIQFEYNVKHSETHSMLGDYHTYLEEAGYILGEMRKDGARFHDFEFTRNNFENGPNYIACKPEFAHTLAIFDQEDKNTMQLGPDADLNKMTEVIQNSPLRLSLDTLHITADAKKYPNNALEKIIKRLNAIGLVAQKKQVGAKRINISFQRPKHYREVENEREQMGSWKTREPAPRYSICVCNYNMEDTLERAMKSVLNQIDKELYEIIVIDDGSNDGSLKELEKLAQAYSNFRYISLPRDSKRHLGETRNISIRAARGEYVLLHIDADDEWDGYLQGLVTLFHKLESAVGHDFMLAGQQTGIAKRDFLLSHGGYENVYRSEDRNLMMKLAKNDQLLFLDYRVYRTRLSRPIRKKIYKTIWDDYSQMVYDLRQNEPKLPYIKHAIMMPFMWKRFSLISCFFRPIAIFPIFIITRFMPPIINHISRAEMIEYHEKHRGSYAEVMNRFNGDADLSFLSKEAQDIYSYNIKLPGFRR